MTTIPSVMYMKNGMKNLVINYDFSCRSVVFCSEKKNKCTSSCRK